VVGATDFGAYSFTPERVTLQWNRKKSKLYAFGRTEYEKKFWSANGKITSILEFLGAQILITLPGSSNANLFNPIPGMRPPDKQKVDIQRSLLIHTIALSISNRRTIWLRGSQLKRGKYVSGYPVFSFIFPTTEADFKQVTTSSDED